MAGIIFSLAFKKGVFLRGDLMAVKEQIGIVSGNGPGTLKWGARAGPSLYGYPGQGSVRERRRNNLSPGSFRKVKHEIASIQPSTLQVICLNRQSKKKAR